MLKLTQQTQVTENTSKLSNYWTADKKTVLLAVWISTTIPHGWDGLPTVYC